MLNNAGHGEMRSIFKDFCNMLFLLQRSDGSDFTSAHGESNSHFTMPTEFVRIQLREVVVSIPYL